VHYVEPETCDPLHETDQGDLIGQVGAQGRRVPTDGDLTVIEFRAQRRAHPAGESDLICLWWHHDRALCVRWLISPASVPSKPGWRLHPSGGYPESIAVLAVTLVPSRPPPRPVNW
jgi:hypothetical protein